MKWLLRTLAALVALVVLVILVGALLPKAHEASRSARYAQPPEAVWRTITDFPAMPSWRADVDRMERGADRNGHPVWVEVSGSDRLPLEVEEAQAPRRMVTRIADPDLPFGGTWTYELKPDAGGTSLTITERGDVYNPLFRFVSKFILGHSATIETYLESLGKKLGET